jgi:hypothetical protein
MYVTLHPDRSRLRHHISDCDHQALRIHWISNPLAEQRGKSNEVGREYNLAHSLEREFRSSLNL